MVTKYIIDTSIALKWLAPDREEHIQEASYILRDVLEKRIHLFTLDFLLIEFTNVLLKGKKMPEDKIYTSLEKLLDLPMQFLPITHALLKSALSIAAHENLSIYDALYAALAKQERLKLITVDKALLKISSLTISLARYHSDSSFN